MNSSDDDDSVVGEKASHILKMIIKSVSSLMEKAKTFADCSHLQDVTDTGAHNF